VGIILTLEKIMRNFVQQSFWDCLRLLNTPDAWSGEPAKAKTRNPAERAREDEDERWMMNEWKTYVVVDEKREKRG
jgi:hypothetical protein